VCSSDLKSPNATDPALIPGNRLLLRPLHAANLMASMNFRRMNWFVGGHYAGRRADSDFLFPPLGITSTPSYVKWDLGNNINVGHRVTLFGTVDNLFNNHYQTTVGYPALRLNWRLGAKYVWGGE
jgi:outer membrane cobalamin receptor